MAGNQPQQPLRVYCERLRESRDAATKSTSHQIHRRPFTLAPRLVCLRRSPSALISYAYNSKSLIQWRLQKTRIL
ncbi:hypothetical protein L6452_08466 [Arctium lappa]|uniref:Uncharacterized protein n=1 Tax=Arctium lappa TaxID=4217 RepID=A0ACB9DHA9_ARCLA|nr:hypothetical protein L6452_08466 [Arctium lappa]